MINKDMTIMEALEQNRASATVLRDTAWVA